MAKEEFGSNATFTGTGESLTIIGNHCYGYNYFAVSNETKTFFDFQSGKQYIVAEMIGGRNMKSGAETLIEVKLNDVLIFSTKWDNGTTGTNNNPMSSATPIIIPPLTRVVITASNDTNDNISLGITGRVYDA